MSALLALLHWYQARAAQPVAAFGLQTHTVCAGAQTHMHTNCMHIQVLVSGCCLIVHRPVTVRPGCRTRQRTLKCDTTERSWVGAQLSPCMVDMTPSGTAAADAATRGNVFFVCHTSDEACRIVESIVGRALTGILLQHAVYVPCFRVCCCPAAAAQSQAEAGSKARKQLQDLLARKAEAITRLQVLQQELEMAQNLNPEGDKAWGHGCLGALAAPAYRAACGGTVLLGCTRLIAVQQVSVCSCVPTAAHAVQQCLQLSKEQCWHL